MMAARNGRERSVELLLAHRGVDINCSDNVSDSVDLRVTVLSALSFCPYLSISNYCCIYIHVPICIYIYLSASIYLRISPSVSLFSLLYISIIYVFIYCYYCHFHSYLQDGWTALMMAARNGKEKSVELLLAHKNIDINCSGNVSDSGFS